MHELISNPAKLLKPACPKDWVCSSLTVQSFLATEECVNYVNLLQNYVTPD